ncbi:hypothetical protein G9A89_002197 [Geosiphon pyriformis]|nr:hypothetical protein G9A89_002197 [Geosiphon pyriformis]
MDKDGLVRDDGLAPSLIGGLSAVLSDGVVSFGSRKRCLFYSGLGGGVTVRIDT